MAWLRTAICRSASTVLTVVTLSVLAPEPVRGGIDACFAALAPVGQISKASEIMAKVSACTGVATSDPLMTMTIAALVAAAAADQFSTSAQCNAAISGAVGKLIAKALAEVTQDEEAKNILHAFADGKVPGVTFDEVLLSIPGGQLIWGYIHCGCAVAGAKGDVDELVEDYKDAAGECFNFASDALDAFTNTVVSGGAAIGEGFHTTIHGPGQTGEVPCSGNIVLVDGLWTKNPIWITAVSGPTPACIGKYVCAPGHVVMKMEKDGIEYNKCAADCPQSMPNSFTPGDKCYSQTVWTVSNGVCSKGGKAVCCGDGQAAFQWGKCEPVCGQGGGLQDSGECAPCKTWQTSAVNRCNDICRKGVYYDPNAPAIPTVSLQSSPSSQTASGAGIVPGQGASSSRGPGNIVAIPGGASALGGKGASGAILAPGEQPLPGGAKPAPGEKVRPKLEPMCIPCGQNEYVENNKCHDCGREAIANAAARTCAPCAQGQVAKLMAGALTCAADCSKVAVAGKQSDTVSANYITNPNDKNRCIECKQGSKPNAAHTACIVVARSTPEKESFTAKSVPALPPKKTTTKETVKGTIAKVQCPPRTHPNPRGTGCVPDLDMQEFGGAGGAPRSGGTRGTPGTPGGFGIMVPGR